MQGNGPKRSKKGRADSQPKVVSETEDAELKALMEQFEQANMDVAGDDDSDEEE